MLQVVSVTVNRGNTMAFVPELRLTDWSKVLNVESTQVTMSFLISTLRVPDVEALELSDILVSTEPPRLTCIWLPEAQSCEPAHETSVNVAG